MDVIELVEALKTADGETAMELVERLQCGKVDCSALSANGGALAATKSAEQVLADNGVFAGADGLRRFAECDTFWEDQMYGARFYFSNELATDYIHRGVLRATVRALESGPANAPPSVAVPEGWKLVPVEPTPEQKKASLDWNDTYQTGGLPVDMNCNIYRAMLTAAPQPDHTEER